MTEEKRLLDEALDLRVRLFGPLELENSWGRVEENRARQSRPWLLLKYLLLEPEREVSLAELQSSVWPPEGDEADSAARVRLKRLRESLAPVRLDGREGLILFSAGYYRLNPRYTIDSDAAHFLRLLERIQQLPLDDPAALHLCGDALRLFRGPFLGDTAEAPWLSPHRLYYRRRFTALALDTLARIRALDDLRPMELLCARAAAFAPEEQELHRALIRLLIEKQQELLLLRHISGLTRRGAGWLDEER